MTVVDTPISVDTPLLAAPRIGHEQAAAYLLRRPHGEYTPQDVAHIVAHYFRIGERVGIDPLLALAQMAHETDTLNSWWAARPRRNPAGLGVTGKPGVGLSFASWEHSSQAHIGRLLAYALNDDEASAEQWLHIGAALYVRPLPTNYRGIARSLKGLTGTWATDPHYSHKLARVANAMLATA